MYARQNEHANDQASDDQGVIDRYKLVLFNNDVLRLDTVSGAVWILEYQRDPQSHQVIKPHWVVVEPLTSDDSH